MSQILVFSGSNSSNSINRKLVKFAAAKISSHETLYIELNELDVPMFGIDYEKEYGVPESIKQLRESFLKADAFMFSSPEHNGSIPAFLKNILDWLSRADEGSIFNDKPVMVLTTSPGPRAGSSCKDHITNIIPFRGASSVFSFSLPSFFENFDSEANKVKSEPLDTDLSKICDEFSKSI
jgi:NAD(P)H-dependent FMN reductase